MKPDDETLAGDTLAAIDPTPLAYSAEEDETEPLTARGRWRPALVWLGLLLLLCASTIVLVRLVMLFDEQHAQSPPPLDYSRPWPPDPVRDQRFVDYMHAHDQGLNNDFQYNVNMARRACEYLRSGHTHDQAWGKLMVQESQMSQQWGHVFIDAAAAAYCPEVGAQ